MIKKYAFKRGQTVALTPEEGVIVTGKIVGFTCHTAKYRKGGEPWVKVSGYNVEEPNGTLWSCGEEDLIAVEETVSEPEPVLKNAGSINVETVQAYAASMDIKDRFVYEVPKRVFTCVSRHGCQTEWDLILFALDRRRFDQRNYGPKADADLQKWLDMNYTGWRGFGK